MTSIKLIILVVLFGVSIIHNYAQDNVIRLWEGIAPGSENWTQTEKTVDTPNGEIIQNVVDPTLTVYVPDREIQTGTAVIICPGGGFRSLSWKSEGIGAAEWLNSKGITAFILKYRTMDTRKPVEQPRNNRKRKIKSFNSPDEVKHANVNPSPENKELVLTINLAVDDALRAIELVRSNAEEWDIDPEKIGFLGFSAGGGVAIGATVRNFSAPDFVATAYGPALTDVVNIEGAPPLFMAVASYHPNVSTGCVALFNEWKTAGNQVELHLYSKGNGPFGMGNNGLPSDDWKNHFHKWLIAEGF